MGALSRRHLRLINGAIILAALCSTGLALAQNLDSEFPVGGEISFEHTGGTGPVLLECRLSDRGSLKCKSDRKLKAVLCQSENRGANENEKNLNRVKISNDAFLCDRAGPTAESYSQIWDLTLFDSEVNFANYIVLGSTQAQQFRSYRAEMTAYPLVRPKLHSLEVASSSQFYTGDFKSVYTGLALTGNLSERWGVHAEYLYPLQKSTAFENSYQLSLGLAYTLLSWDKFSLSLGVGMRSEALLSSERVSSTYFEVPMFFREESALIRPLLRLQQNWVWVERFRQDIAAEAGLRIGPLRSKFYLTPSLTYRKATWSSPASQIDQNLMSVQIALAYFTGNELF